MAVTLVTIHQVNTASIIQARAAVTLINLVTADGPHVPRVADAGIGINPILALAMVARIWVTVVDILLTQDTSEACRRKFTDGSQSSKQAVSTPKGSLPIDPAHPTSGTIPTGGLGWWELLV